jgi:hypothetical protein
MNGKIDRNGMRGGAAVSVVALVVAYLVGYSSVAGRAVVVAVAIALGIGSIFGPRRSPLGAIYRAVKKALKLDIPVEPEDEGPPRFAQTLGFVFLVASSSALFAGARAAGWALALLVAGLQALLAVTGICVGCEMYLIGKRLSAKSA